MKPFFFLPLKILLNQLFDSSVIAFEKIKIKLNKKYGVSKNQIAIFLYA
jgi:hypothetical protein